MHPCFAKAEEIGVSGSIAKYGSSPTVTIDTNMYKEQQIDNAVAIPKGRSRCGFFTCLMIMEELGILINVNYKKPESLKTATILIKCQRCSNKRGQIS
jgi:hypothetical protein